VTTLTQLSCFAACRVALLCPSAVFCFPSTAFCFVFFSWRVALLLLLLLLLKLTPTRS
jgi:hypothetical protein